MYNSIEGLQEDLDKWLEMYNTQRSHSGKRCEGKTPLQTFEESKQLAFEKNLDSQNLTVEAM